MTEPIQPLHPSPVHSSPRIGDVERAATADTLSAHFAAGRLRPDELDWRLEQSMNAVTAADLYAVLWDLPRPPAPPQVAPVPRPSSAGWTALDGLTVLTLVGTLLVSGVLLLVMGAQDYAWFIGALLGGTAAALGGACIAHLIHRSQDRARTP